MILRYNTPISKEEGTEKMVRIVTGWMVLALWAGAAVSDRQIANMFVLGFDGKKLSGQSPVVKDICERGLGGVILFGKNVASPTQLKALTAQLNRCPHKPLIAVDQEGGKVRRIRFGQEYPRASQVGRMGTRAAGKLYDGMGSELQRLGINYNLAPVADLDMEPRNYIIHKLGRSYGADPRNVAAFDTAFIRAMHHHRILTSLKHYPGHGSSLGDTHKGFVDVTKQWQPKELEPFTNSAADSVMIAHVVNRQIDPSGRPMSLSRTAITRLRRRNPQVVAITDDLQMGAIRKHYTLEQTLALAIGAGNDLLLFGNQLTKKEKVSTAQLIGIVRSLIRQGRIDERSIIRANRRIARMRSRIGLQDGEVVPSRTTARPKPVTTKLHRKQPRKQIRRKHTSGDMF